MGRQRINDANWPRAARRALYNRCRSRMLSRLNHFNFTFALIAERILHDNNNRNHRMDLLTDRNSLADVLGQDEETRGSACG